MANHTAIAAVSRTLAILLQDRMVTGVDVTMAPPDQTVTGMDGARVNLYLFEVIENASLKNDDGPVRGHPGRYGRPPLSLNLRYMLTSYGDTEVLPQSDLRAQEILGDAMRVLHTFGARLHEITRITLAPPELEEPILDEALRRDYERVKITLFPTSLEDVTRVWSSLSEQNFRRTVIYEATVVQIENLLPDRLPAPVQERRVFATLARRPLIERAFLTPAAEGEPENDMRVAVGEEITLVVRNANAERIFVQFGELPLMRVQRPVHGRISVTVPDDTLTVEFDPDTNQPIAPEDRLQPGTLQIRVIVEVATEGVGGSLGRGARIEDDEPRRFISNVALMQLVPQITSIAPAEGPTSSIITITGTRLWHERAFEAQVVVGDAGIDIRSQPGLTEPSSTSVQVPVGDADLAVRDAGDPASYPVAVIVDGARSRETGFGFLLDP